jgi:hypothetical protein
LQTLRCGQVYRYGMLLAFHVHRVFNPQEWVRRLNINKAFFVATLRPAVARNGLLSSLPTVAASLALASGWATFASRLRRSKSRRFQTSSPTWNPWQWRKSSRARRVHFILSPQQGSGAQDGKHEGDVVARTRLDASWDNIRPFLFFARPSCEMLYFEMFYLMTPRSESSMNLMSIVTSSLKSASALSFSRACVVLSLEFNSSL